MRTTWMRFAAGGLICFLTASAQEARPTASQVIEQIKKNVGVPWTEPTVDTFKAGNPDTPVTGIAVTMMATYDVLQRAAASGKNLIITHEPTFYSHQDATTTLEAQNDQVLAAKQAFIKEHNLVVWRFHDYWHRRRPDGILHGMTHELGWEKYQNADEPHLFVHPEMTVDQLAEEVKTRLQVRVLRIVGDLQMKTSKVAFLPGAGGPASQIKMLERQDVETLMIGEVPEWETIEYAADASAEGKRKALILIGHIPSEQAGMKECADWLKTFVKGVPIEFVPASEFFRLP